MTTIVVTRRARCRPAGSSVCAEEAGSPTRGSLAARRRATDRPSPSSTTWVSSTQGLRRLIKPGVGESAQRAAADRATQRYLLNEHVSLPGGAAPIWFAPQLLYVSMEIVAEHQRPQHIDAPGHQQFRATSSRALSDGRQRATGQRRPTLRRLPGILRRRGRPSTRPPRRTRHVQVLDVPMTRPFPRSTSHRSRRSRGRHH